MLKEEIEHNFPMPHKDVMEQVIDYKAPPEKFDELARYDGSVIVERTRGELSARCDKEGANFLAINLAHEVVEGKRSVDDARKFYAETMKAAMAGKTSEYMQGFTFKTPKGGTADPDQAVIKK